MSKKTKLVLSIIGISAIVVPALLLIFLTRKGPEPAAEDAGPKRTIDSKAIEETVKQKLPSPSPAPTFVSTPVSTPSATTSPESTTSAQ